MRLVLDTNVLMSALLFPRGRLHWLKDAWRSGDIVPVLSLETLREIKRVLDYPKFKLSADQQKQLLSTLMPYAECAISLKPYPVVPKCRDPDDEIFMVLAISAQADGLVTGDADLLSLADRFPLPILTPAALYNLTRT
jgi:uncharacterized protein